ncbi:hypothetical protein [Mesorhizobium sp. CN2-181]|uniref:hypothetical protein n=1 Tax=Mesorhizobium yinganensis TaxID=3157707 RepID=UPI0032B7CA48
MTAAEKLAEAHKSMPPEDIAEHALALAMVVESQDNLIRSLVEDIDGCRTGVTNTVSAFRSMQIAVRTVASANASRRFSDARKMIAELADIPVMDEPVIPAPLYIPAEESWPEIYSPKPR